MVRTYAGLFPGGKRLPRGGFGFLKAFGVRTDEAWEVFSRGICIYNSADVSNIGAGVVVECRFCSRRCVAS
jgi:hypothetical protein